MIKKIMLAFIILSAGITGGNAAEKSGADENVARMKQELVEILKANEEELKNAKKELDSPLKAKQNSELENTAADVIRLSQTKNLNLSNDTLRKSQQIIDIVASMNNTDMLEVINDLKKYLAENTVPVAGSMPAAESAE